MSKNKNEEEEGGVLGPELETLDKIISPGVADEFFTRNKKVYPVALKMLNTPGAFLVFNL